MSSEDSVPRCPDRCRSSMSMACYHYSCAARSSERTAVRVTLSVSSDESPVLLGRYEAVCIYIFIYIIIYIAEDQTLHLRAQAGSFSPLRSNWVPAVMRSDVCANGHGDSGNFDTGTYYYLFKSAFLRHPAVIFEAMLSGQIRWTKSPI